MSSVYLVRLGQTEHNVAGVWSGRRVDSPLTSVGVAQARKVAELLAPRGIAAICSSPMPRVVETAEWLGDLVHLPVTQADQFTEIDIGDLDGKTKAQAITTPAGEQFQVDPTSCVFPGARTSLFDSQKAAVAKVKALMGGVPEGQAIAIYTHGGLMRLLLLGLLHPRQDLSSFWRYQIGNCAVAHVYQKPDDSFELAELLNFGEAALSQPVAVVRREDLPVVRLRPVTEADWETYVQWRSDPDISGPMFAPVDEARLQLERVRFEPGGKPGEIYRAVEDGSGRHIGDIRIRRADDVDHTGPLVPHGVWSFGIHIAAKELWGQGYGKAATLAALALAFGEEVRAERVQLHAWSGNDRAIRCFERVGFRREGLHRRRWCKGDEWRDEVTMAILCDEYQRLWGAEGRTPRQER